MADDFKKPERRYGWAWAIVTIGMFLGFIIWFFNIGDGLSDTQPTIEEEVTSQQPILRSWELYSRNLALSEAFM